MRQELALDEDGSPHVRPFRDDEGYLRFRYLVVRPGGMAVWIEVPEAGAVAFGVGGVPDPSLAERLRGERHRLAESVAAGDEVRSEQVTGLTAQVEALGEQLDETRAELELARAEADRLRAEHAAATGGPKARAKPTRQRRAAA